ncbi:hypothetical protein M501DRAFT_989782 [Patellaria atrata CBS 101060]|uniref:Uncharacterized protein n=1 Tax=Patellaria atrata CBS 101060 TaxID=1346257 RepID=A0A9P4VRS0_9PEZI|nr:hypothetical protein M501DRAFT_989782 [Patellaria atrata CBS 101060]
MSRPPRTSVLPPSPAHSAYDVNLSALPLVGDESTDDLSLNLDEAIVGTQLDVLRSDDVGGPSDFTENMEWWINGGHRKGSIKKRSEKRGMRMVDTGVGASSVNLGSKELGTPDLTSGTSANTQEEEVGDDEDDEEEGASEEIVQHHHAPDVHLEKNEEESMIDLDASIEEQEKALSYLSAPDDEEQPALSTPNKNRLSSTGTTIHKAMSQPTTTITSPSRFQPTVEDYQDTPRKISPLEPAQQSRDMKRDDDAAIMKRQADEIQELNRLLERNKEATNAQIIELQSRIVSTRDEGGNKVKALETQLTSLRHALQVSQKERQEEIDTHATEEERLSKEAENRAMNLTNQLQKAQSEFHLAKSNLERTKAQSQKYIESQSTEIITLKTQVATLQKQLSDRATQESLEAERLQQQATAVSHTEALAKLNIALSDQAAILSAKDKELEQATKKQQEMTEYNAKAASEFRFLELRAHDLQTQLQTARNELTRARVENNELRQSLSQARETVRSANHEKEEVVMELQNAKTIHEFMQTAAKQEKEDDDELIRSQEERLESLKKAQSEEARRMRLKAEEAIVKVSQMLEAERKARLAMRGELNDLRRERDDALTRLEAASNEIVQLKLTASTEKIGEQDIASDDSIDMARLREELSEHRTIIQSLRKELAQAKLAASRPAPHPAPKQTPKFSQLDNANYQLRTDLAASNSLVNSLREDLIQARRDIDQAYKDLAETRIELEAAQDEHEQLDRDVEAKAVELVKKKENEWKERLQELKKERNGMGKILMREWGKAELGVTGREGGGQEYEYQYVKR